MKVYVLNCSACSPVTTLAMLSHLLYNAIAFLLTYTTSYPRIQYSSFQQHFANIFHGYFFSASKFSLLKFMSLQKST